MTLNRKSREDAYVNFPPAYLPYITPVAELRRIATKDLQLETHHQGKYLLLQCITPPSHMKAIMALMKDESDEAIVLQLYQQEDEEPCKATELSTSAQSY